MDADFCRCDVLTVHIQRLPLNPHIRLTDIASHFDCFAAFSYRPCGCLIVSSTDPDFHCFTWHFLAPLAAYTCTFPLWGFMVERTGAFHYGLPNWVLTKTCGGLEVAEQTEGVPF